MAISLKDIQEYAEGLCNKQGWGNESLETRLHYLKGEIMEAEIEISKYFSQTAHPDKEEVRDALGYELFDIIWNVAELANRFNIDLELASEQKMNYNTNREFSKSPFK